MYHGSYLFADLAVNWQLMVLFWACPVCVIFKLPHGHVNRHFRFACAVRMSKWLIAQTMRIFNGFVHYVLDDNYLRRRRRLCFWCGLFVCLSVCLSVCPSDYSQTCERILTKFFGGVGHGSRTKWYNFCGDRDHASDPGVQSPKSGSSGSAEVCALWA